MALSDEGHPKGISILTYKHLFLVCLLAFSPDPLPAEPHKAGIELDCRRFGELIVSTVFHTKQYWVSESGGRYGRLDSRTRERDGFGLRYMPNPPFSGATCKIEWRPYQDQDDFWIVGLNCSMRVPVADGSNEALRDVIREMALETTSCLRDHYNEVDYVSEKLTEIDPFINFKDLIEKLGPALFVGDLESMEELSLGDDIAISYQRGWGSNFEDHRSIRFVAFQDRGKDLGLVNFAFEFIEKAAALGPEGMPASP